MFHKVRAAHVLARICTTDGLIFEDSPYRDILSDTILKLQDEGIIQKYYNKWWKEAANLKCDQEDKRKDMASELGFANIGGIFVILAAGLLLSMVVAAIEFSIKIRNRKGRQVRSIIRERRYEWSSDLDLYPWRNGTILPFCYLQRQCFQTSSEYLHQRCAFTRSTRTRSHSKLALQVPFRISVLLLVLGNLPVCFSHSIHDTCFD